MKRMITTSGANYFMMIAPGHEYEEYDVFETSTSDPDSALAEYRDWLPDFYFKPKNLRAVPISKKEYTDWIKARDKALKRKYANVR